MGRIYYKELPLFHLYDSDLTCTQKLLMTLLMVARYDIYDHIPPRLFKEAVHLNRMKEQIMAILNDTNPFNKKAKLDELEALLGKYVPGAEALRTKLKKYDAAYKALTAENAALEKQLGAASKESVLKKLEINEKLRELDELHRMVDVLPPEILQAAKQVAAHKPQER